MRSVSLFQKIILTAILFGGCVGVAHAGVADRAIKTWNTPAPEGVYGYQQSVVYQGTVQIPAGWVGRIRVCRDLGSSACINSFIGSQSFDNSQTGTTTETFSIDTGAWSSGEHVARIAFDGFAGCRVVCAPTDTACQIANNSDADPTNDWCEGSTENSVPDQTYPTRTITVGPPPTPSLIIGENPINFWGHVVNSSVATYEVTLTNEGAPGTTAIGSVVKTSGGARFSCQSGCDYSILAGAEHTVTLAFTPGGSAGNWTGTFDLPCSGCVVPVQTISVDGETIPVASPAEISLDVSSVNFGTVNVATSRGADVEITNTGGTSMNGRVDLNDPQITCDGSCNFSVNAGQSILKRFYYEPTVADPLTGVTATFRATSGGASSVVVPVTGEGNDDAYLAIWSPTTYSDLYDGDEIVITHVNSGDSSAVELELYNPGAGLLSASLGGVPSGIFSCVSGCGPYVNVRSYPDTGEYRVIRIEFTLPMGTTEQTLPLTFTDTTPGGSGEVIHVTVRVVPNADPIPEMVGEYPCQLNFGNVLVGDSTLPLPDADTGDSYFPVGFCGIRNAGVGSLRVTIPDFSLNGTGRYDCVVGPGYSCGTFFLGAGEEARFTYRFTALAGDPDTNMHHWDPVEYVSAFEGLPSGDAIHIHASPMSMSLALNPLSDPAYDFGTININSTSSRKIYNTALRRIGGINDPIWYSALPGGISYSVANTPHFKCTRSCTWNLSFSGATARGVNVVFAPGADTGVIAETLSVSYVYSGWTNAPASTPLTIDLSGEGNDQPILELSGDITPPVVDFGTVNVGTPQTLLVRLSNIGVGNLTGSFGAFAAPFSCVGTNCAGFTIPQGSFIELNLEYTPSLDVFSEDFVTLTTTGGNRTLTLRGTGKFEPELILSTNFINFDTLTDPASQTNVGDVRTTTFRVSNTGMGMMSVTAGLTTPTSNFLFPSQSLSLAAGESTDLSVQFAPIRDSVPLSGQLTLSATDGGSWSDSKTIDLVGIGGLAPLTDFRGTRPSFGPVVYGQNKTLTITIRNAGVRPLGQGTFTFPEGSPFVCIGPIGASGGCDYDIGPNGEHTLTVVFTPDRIGSVSVRMGLSSLPEYGIDFTGTGVPPRFNYKEQ